MKQAFWKETAPAPTRREQRKQEFREKIMAAAIELFEQKGCDATTLEEICELAGVSRPTFYSYYPSKQDLVHALVEKLWFRVAADMTELSLQGEAPMTQYISTFFEMTRRQFVEYDRLERELIRQSMSSDPGDATNMNLLQGLTAMFEAVYRQGLERGEMTHRYPADFLAEMSMGVISTLMMKWAVDEHYPLENRLQQAEQLLLDLIRP